MTLDSPSRRRLLQATLAASGSLALPALHAAPAPGPAPLLTRPIPSSGEQIPVMGLGSWITFNVGRDPQARKECQEVMRQFFAGGGRMIDSSPMYGSAQDVIGEAVQAIKPPALFSADKVWISGGARGVPQIETSRKLWRVPRFDLLQVHNLLSWEEHLKTLLAMKREGRLRQMTVPEPTSSPSCQPSSIGPPDRTIAGISTVDAAMIAEGVVLSHPVVSTTPSSG